MPCLWVRDLFVEYFAGFRKGALWSLVIAIPTAFAVYGEFALSRSFEFDPVTETSTRVDLTVTDVCYCAIAAFVTAATGVTLPWALVAGFVERARERKRRAESPESS